MLMFTRKPLKMDPTLETLPTISREDTIGHDDAIGQDHVLTGIFEPAEGSLVRAIAGHKLIIAFFAVVLAALGVGFGLSRSTTYTASATLQVGQVNPNSPGFLGYVQSSSSLATAFSRAVESAPVLAKIDKTLKLSPEEAAPRLSSEPIPLSPAFRVIATGGSAKSAMQLANVAAGAVISYESSANSSNPEAHSLLKEYREVTQSVQKAQLEIAGFAAAKQVTKRLKAEAAREAAKERRGAIARAYEGAVTSQAPREGLVSLLAGATSTSNNHKSKVELYGFLGLLLGIAAGCGIAIMLGRRRTRRSL
jgi:capsular polysaccharide biosynthesis protein